MTDPEAVIRTELSPEERLLWAGNARKGVLIRPQDWVTLLIGFIWSGLMLTALILTLLQEAAADKVPAYVCLAVFALSGLAMACGPLLMDRWRRQNTCYGVSNERIIIVQGSSYRTVRSLNLDTLIGVMLMERPNGSGTITYGPFPSWWGWNAGPNLTPAGWQTVAQFELAADVRRVSEVIREARRSLKQRD